ncbi:MAG: hypothetical protein R3346_00255 [Candidatus Spechtbacterales bacterium]|nr:hypothetical protein [Candidatus Spechtbacterales bacterium]
MKVNIFGRNKEELTPVLKEMGFRVGEESPEFIISYGGDGTIMQAEHKYPEIPKIALRNSAICKKCPPLDNEEILSRVINGKYSVEELYKLQVSCKRDDTLIKHGMDSIIVHNADPRRAMRYKLNINGEKINVEDIIGDGIVVATPFGSTGYYRSITDSFFEVGIGVAFNNSTEQSDHMVVSEDSIIELEVTRGPAVVYADNQDGAINLDKGDKIRIKKSPQVVRLLQFK